MLEAMLEGWRGKRVLIVGDRGGLCVFLIAVLDEIGARPVCVSDRADAQTLCRALTAGRVSAAILPGEMTGRSLPERLEATLVLTREMREGMEASILQMALLGAARGLLGDAVRTMLVRHAPVLGEEYTAWCDALLEGRTIRVRHPAARGVFVHPLDVVCCGLTLGARAFRCGEGGVYNIGTDERSVCTRQSAARRLAMRHGGAGTAQEETEDGEPPAQLLDGSAARRLCGAACRLDVDQALDLLFEQRRAARAGQEEAAIRRMTRTYLEGCRA